MYNQNAFAGGVQARTVAGGTVKEPSVVTLDGVAVELTLADATTLRDGLNDAIATVADAESALRAGDVGYITSPSVKRYAACRQYRRCCPRDATENAAAFLRSPQASNCPSCSYPLRMDFFN